MQDQANREARTAARAVSSNQKGLTRAALHKDISEREKKCRDALHQQRFIRQTATRSGPDCCACQCRCVSLDAADHLFGMF